MKKALFIFTLAFCSQQMYAASEPLFSVHSGPQSWGMPGTTVEFGPLKYKIYARRLVGYATVGALSAIVNATRDHRVDQNLKEQNHWESSCASHQLYQREKFELSPKHFAKELAAEIAADIIYDSVDPSLGEDTSWMGTFAKSLLHSAIYNVTRNATDGFQTIKLYFPLIEFAYKL